MVNVDIAYLEEHDEIPEDNNFENDEDVAIMTIEDVKNDDSIEYGVNNTKVICDDNLIVEDSQVAGETNADRIIRIITKIKDKRNRANYDSIFDKVHINMDTTKQIIHNLIQQNINS